MIAEFLLGILDGLADGWLDYRRSYTRPRSGRKSRNARSRK